MQKIIDVEETIIALKNSYHWLDTAIEYYDLGLYHYSCDKVRIEYYNAMVRVNEHLPGYYEIPANVEDFNFRLYRLGIQK
jgi:hypothetical protein